ncbi:hypothetical protein ACIA5D_28430 [Actinoplanes sp. NPDC051513]|uniref:hypothetical protein n=1 Tax=Actinoplanes sp. NPDC051513 TaxID=3363908 RepID=UPI0037B58F6E
MTARRQPNRGLAASTPTGLVRRSVVSPVTVTGEAAVTSGAATLRAHGPAPYAPRSRAATQVSGMPVAACHAPSVTRSAVPAAEATRRWPRSPAGPALVLRTATRRVLPPGRSAAARST